MNICLEYVSANPNGPITIQHARAAVVGDILARVFAEAGHSVTREFYVNDAPGTTLTAFARSVAAEADPFAAEIARSARGATLSDILAAVRVRQSASLAELGVTFDSFVSEAELLRSGEVDKLLTDLTAAGHTTWRGGALWLKSAALGDEQDRPLVRTLGGASYLASDLTYHRQKLARGFDQLIDLWSDDHGAYAARTRAGLRALGCTDGALRIGLIAPVRILKDGQERRVGRYGASSALEEILPQTTPQQLRWWFAEADPSTPQVINLDVPTQAPAQLLAALERPLEKQKQEEDEAETALRAACAAVALALEQARETLSPRPVADAAMALAHALTSCTAAAPITAEGARTALKKLLAILGI